jgi:hypothetical protein
MVTNLMSIIAALMLTESGGNPAALGDNKRAVGVLQMWPIQVAEVNRILKHSVYKPHDRHCSAKSQEMCGIFLTYWADRRGLSKPEEIAGLWRNPSGKVVPWYRSRFLEHYKGVTNAPAYHRSHAHP